MTGFRAVAYAADQAARDRGDPTDPQQEQVECQALLDRLEQFRDDPITKHYVLGADVDEWGPSVTRAHVFAHGCQGFGRIVA